MVYLDTRLIAPLVVAEGTSDAVEAWVMTLKPGELATSLWTHVELASLASHKLSCGRTSAEAAFAPSEFEPVLDESFEVLSPTAAHFVVLAKYVEVTKIGPRAGTRFTWPSRRTTPQHRSSRRTTVSSTPGARSRCRYTGASRDRIQGLRRNDGFIQAGTLAVIMRTTTRLGSSKNNVRYEQPILRKADSQLSLRLPISSVGTR